MSSHDNNIMVMQSGGCTAVINRSLAGIIRAAGRVLPESRVYGAAHGMEGLISGKIPDLTEISTSKLSSLDTAPGAALGSTRRKLRDEDVAPILATLDQHDIHILHIIGGNDSAETGMSISNEARIMGYDLKVVNVPKTIDNDLTETDHCPGYGSAARFIAQATLGAGRDAAAMGISSPITIIEIMGRDAGWLSAAGSMYKRDRYDPPHYIGVPEITFYEDVFLLRMEEAYRENGYAIAVVAENIKGPEGAIGGQTEPWFVDDFGHPYYDGPARYLAEKVSRRLGVRCRHEKPGTIQRSFMDSVSRTDAMEARMVGEAAIKAAAAGETDVIVSLVRGSNSPYKCDVNLVPLDKVAGNTRTLPEKYLPDESGNTSGEFKEYLEPLLGKTVQIPEHLLR